MNPISAYIGGLRSGKSQAALEDLQAALKRGKRLKPAYFGTLLSAASRKDASLAKRLAGHRAARPLTWATVEVGEQLLRAGLAARHAGYDAWLVDGLGPWVALRMRRGEAALLGELDAFLQQAAKAKTCLIVLDEVGLGGVPGHPVARDFADLNGLVNQAVVRAAKRVFGVQAGLKIRLK